ncbi:hypothetical protein EPN52_13285 [bacterium]|nr:MAG: hypothetical protein EPN52_13285 [bacterium]
MSRYVRVASVTDLPAGGSMAVTVGERRVALFHTERGWFALDDTCPHQGMPLSEGHVEGGCVTCAWHAWTFDLRTGAMTFGDFEGVAAYDVLVRGADVLVAPRPRAAGDGQDLPTARR